MHVDSKRAVLTSVSLQQILVLVEAGRPPCHRRGASPLCLAILVATIARGFNTPGWGRG